MNIKLNWVNIKYEVDQETWKAARTMITGEGAEELSANATTGVDQFDANFCYRQIESGISHLADILNKFFGGFGRQAQHTIIVGDRVRYMWQARPTIGEVMTKTGTGANTVYHVRPIGGGFADITQHPLADLTYIYSDGENALDNNSTYWNIILDFPTNRNSVDAQMLTAEMHKYMVMYVLQEWSKIALPKMEADYMQRMANAEAMIKRIAYRKDTPELDD